MSDLNPAPPAMAAPTLTGPSDPTFFGHFLSAMRMGAAYVYHKVVAAEAVVTAWESDPIVGALIQEGVAVGSAFLTAHGIPVAQAHVAFGAVQAFLAEMAANDATVPSLSPAQQAATTQGITP